MAGHTAENSGGCNRPVVLVVEDEIILALDLQAMLEGNGYSVLGLAGTVDAALRLLAHEQPDLAVLDVNLNGQPVVRVAKRLRSLGIPFVLASAYSSFDFVDGEVLAGVENVGKPVTERQLLAALGRLAGGPGLGKRIIQEPPRMVSVVPAEKPNASCHSVHT